MIKEAIQVPNDKKNGLFMRNQALYRCLDRAVIQVMNLDTSDMSQVDIWLWEDLLSADEIDNFGLISLRNLLRSEAELKGLNYGW